MRSLSLTIGRIASVAMAIGLISCNTTIHAAYALTNGGQQIIEFQTGSTSSSAGSGPGTIVNTATISGVASGDSLVQLAYRPSTGVLYGVTGDNELYTIDPVAGLATLISTSQFITDTLTNIAISFDPVHDQLRVIATDTNSPTGFENLRIDPDDGSLINAATTLAYINGTAGNGTTGSPQIDGLAYIDAVIDAPTTTLYGLDVASQQLVQIGSTDTNEASDADAGLVQTIGTTGLTFGASLGFAIAPDGLAYAALAPTGSGATLYAIDLATGAATSLGVVGTGNYTLISLVIAP